MKIIFCLHHFLPDYIAGTEVYTFNLATNLRSMGVDVAVVIPNYRHALTEEYEWKGIRVIRYAENSVEDREMIMGKKVPEGIGEFKKIIEREKPAVVHFHELAPGYGINIFHVEVVYNLNIKIVTTMHLASYSCYTGTLVYKNIKHCDGLIEIDKCTKCAFTNKGITGLKQILLVNGGEIFYKAGIDATNWNTSIGTALGFPFVIDKIRKDLLKLAAMSDKIVVLTRWYNAILIKNGVPPVKLAYISQGLIGDLPVNKNIRSTSLPLKLIFIGRINVFKGLALLIDALISLPQQKISLDIYGPDADEEYAAECRQKAAVLKNIEWKGSVSTEEIMRQLPGYDLLCLPSAFSEMSPLVIQEAFAAGVPVLASNVYGNSEQIEDGVNGWLFQFKNAGDLKRKLEALIEQPELITSAKKHIPSVKSFTEVSRQYYSVYKEILTSQTMLLN